MVRLWEIKSTTEHFIHLELTSIVITTIIIIIVLGTPLSACH